MAELKVKLIAQGGATTCSLFDVSTGEYYQKLGYVEIYDDVADYDPDNSDLFEWFVVFSRDKREYESQVDLDIDETIEYLKGSFDIPIFDKEGYIYVGVYGYKKIEETNFNGESTIKLERIYSSTPCLCEIKKGIYPVKPQPSPNTYEKLNRRIEELSTGIGDVTDLREWKDKFVNEQFVTKLRDIFHYHDDTNTYIARYNEIYELIDYYFYPDASHDPGGYADKILNRYFEVKIKQNTSGVWEFADPTSMSFDKIRDAIRVEHLIPYISYETTNDTHRTMYSEILDNDQIIFPESVILDTSTSSTKSVKVINFTIWRDERGITREEVELVGGKTDQFEVLAHKVETKDELELKKTKDYYPSVKAILEYITDKGYEVLSNKEIDAIDKTRKSTDKYTSEKVVVNYAEDKGNKKDVVNESTEEYPSSQAVVNYAEKKDNKKDSIADSSVEYPSSKAIISYSEALTNRDDTITKGSIIDKHYPATKAVVEYLTLNYTDIIKSGKVIRSEEGEGTISNDPDNEIIYTIPAGFSGTTTVSGKLCNHVKVVPSDTTITGKEPKIYSPTTGIITSMSLTQEGNWQIVIYTEAALGADTQVIMQYYYYDIKYKYNLYFYQDKEGTIKQESIKPIDLSDLGGGGSGGGGTAFDSIQVVEQEGTYTIRFYKGTSLITSIGGGSLAKVQLNEATFNEAGTNLLLKNKSGDTLADAQFNFVTTAQMTTLKGLI